MELKRSTLKRVYYANVKRGLGHRAGTHANLTLERISHFSLKNSDVLFMLVWFAILHGCKWEQPNCAVRTKLSFTEYWFKYRETKDPIRVSFFLEHFLNKSIQNNSNLIFLNKWQLVLARPGHNHYSYAMYTIHRDL